jgi:hypothetical protein
MAKDTSTDPFYHFSSSRSGHLGMGPPMGDGSCVVVECDAVVGKMSNFIVTWH